MSQVKEALEHYKNGNFKQAIVIFKQLGELIGSHLFKANIDICEKRIFNKKSSKAISNVINVVFIADENYSLPTYVAIYSLIRNKNIDTEVDLTVVGINLSNASVIAIKSLETADVKVSIIIVDKDYSNFQISKKGFHVSTSAIVKFILPDLLKNIDRVLYIDGDVLIQKDLHSLYNINLDESFAAVVKDIKPTVKYDPSILNRLNIQNHRNYFNSGVMVLNLKFMRENEISQRLFQYRSDGVNFFMDQDAFNVVFEDKVKYISNSYNLLMTLPESFSISEICKEYNVKYKVNSFIDLIKSAHILHYASSNKPWKNLNGDNFSLWHRYYISSGAVEKDFPGIDIRLKNKYINKVIVSLTSYPPRIGTVHLTIKSLLSQNFRPDSVILWLSQDDFPNLENSLPNSLLSLLPNGLSIRWCKNLKSYKKLIPSLELFPDNIIVTADDDIVYDSTWLEQLVASYLQSPNYIHCLRAHKILVREDGTLLPYANWIREAKDSTPSFNTFFTGCGGVLYPPGSLFPSVANENDFVALCESGDDIWFWGMAVLNGTKIKLVAESSFHLNFVENSQNIALWKENDWGGRNDIMIYNLLNKFPNIRSILLANDLS